MDRGRTRDKQRLNCSNDMTLITDKEIIFSHFKLLNCEEH